MKRCREGRAHDTINVLAFIVAFALGLIACQAQSPPTGSAAAGMVGVVGVGGAPGGVGMGGASGVPSAGASGAACAAGQTSCSGNCVSLADSLFHCGQCGNACVDGRSCVAGQCGCASGLSDCGGVCVNSMSDVLNCGGCGMACAPSQGCNAGVCSCPGTAAFCGGSCVDTQIDTLHCGGCGMACVTGQECGAGACSCQGGLANCGGTCLDTASNPDNCGGCGTVCSADQVCSNGMCAMGCADGLTNCDRSCVNPMTSAFHCGGCGVACGAGQSCVGGMCSCPGGLTSCDGQCVDTLTSLSHCGSCGYACAGGASCQNGMCACPDGLELCNGQCVDVQTDGLNCGGCGNICLAGECAAGACPGVKDCAVKTLVTEPGVADFEDYDGATAIESWSFTFNAEPGMEGEVPGTLYHYSDETGAQSLSMGTGNASLFGPGIANTQATAWGGGFGVWMRCIDATAYDGISFYARGNAPAGVAGISLSMEQTNAPSADDPAAGGTCEADVCEGPSAEFPVNASWTRVLLPWSSFTPGTAGTMSVPATGNNLGGFSVSVPLAWGPDPNDVTVYGPLASGYELQIDDIAFFNESEVCAPGQVVCASTCVDTTSNAEHCGACGMACGGGQGCSNSQCNCPAGETYCVDSCVNLQTHASHCGACGKVCSLTATCSSGTCTGGNSTTSNRCGSSMQLLGNPLGCDFGWGANDGGNLPSYVDFASKWVGYEQNINTTCDGCGWLSGLSSSSIVPLYIAYFIAYRANLESGLGDCNTDGDGNNLCTGGAQWIRSNRSRIISLYQSYAQRSYSAYSSKPVIWLVEPDFIQYLANTQSNPLSMSELGQLATDIVCAIKSNMPNAVIALTHSTWVAEPTYTQYWSAMPLDLADLVHATGQGNVSGGYINTGDSYNRSDGTWAYLGALTGKPIIADTSFGVTTMDDTWAASDASTLNARIADGVAGALVYPTPGNYQSRISTLASQLSSTCQ